MGSRRFRCYLVLLAVLALVLVASAGAATYTNPAAIPITDASDDFPPAAATTTSTIQVSEVGTVSSVTVSLVNMSADFADDLDIALISPDNTKVVLMSDAGSNPPPITPARPWRTQESQVNPGSTLTFSDSGGVMPAFASISTGTYHPVDYPASQDPFCSGESDQPPSYTTTLSSFTGHPTSGTWTLNIRDDCFGGIAAIQNGWCLIINSSSGPCQQSTVVSLAVFTSRRVGKETQLSWRTVQEIGVAGYNVFRVGAGKTAKVNRTLIVVKAAGAVRGASYRAIDRTATRGVPYTYRLQAVYTNATRGWVGAAHVGAS